MSALRPLPPGAARHFGWTRASAIASIVSALTDATPDGVRFVGGCVRDSLCRAEPKDIDIATTLTPDRVVEALLAAGLGAAPTGIEHGTVTAIAHHYGVEVTTLRADISTDGRRATVAFTTDWARDAGRRDFTINAIYATPDLQLFDPAGGAEDLAARRVRFIGDARRRIEEDYLRILRFFRFSARFADAFDKEGLAACAERKAGIERLSAERIGDEFGKLLDLPAPAKALAAMAETSVLREVWTAEPALDAAARLKSIAPDTEYPLVLAALWPEGEGIDSRLRLSNAAAARRKAALVNASAISQQITEHEARKVLYRIGADRWRDAMLLARARSDGDDARFELLAELPERWRPPERPFSGKDVLSLGVAPGRAVSAILEAAERRWVEEDFPSQARAHEILKEEAAHMRRF